MAGRRVLVTAVLVVVGAAFPLVGQQPGAVPPRTKQPGTTAGKVFPRRGVPAAQPGAPINPPAGVNAAVQPASAQPAAVTPQAVEPAPAPAAAAGFTAGLGVSPFAGTGDAARYDYLRTLARNLDSATVVLVDLYRNTSGQPMAGASSATALSARERDRWTRCRNLYWDFTSFTSGLHGVGENLANAAVARAVASLDTALAEVEALSECDNVASMISAPERWDPWAQQYATAARHFYSGWYGQVLAAHDRDRELVQALNPVLPAGRVLAIPPRMPRNPPYAGAGVR
jgi:hypothetical protein